MLITFRYLIWRWEGICPGSENAGWCGCGEPHTTYIFIRDALRGLPWYQSGFFAALPSGAATMLAARLDNMHLVEHGTSWHGGWLTDFGQQVLAVLDPMTDADIEAAYDEIEASSAPIDGCYGEDCQLCKEYGGRVRG